MSNKTNKEFTVTFDGFGGINATSGHSDPTSAEDLLNFRIRKDGSLEKRCGYRYFMDLSSPILAYWSGIIQSEFRYYLVAGSTVWSVDLKKCERKTVGTLPSNIDHACFFFYRGALYLLAGSTFWELRNDTLVATTGYVPLVGKDWNNREVGEIYEPRNILTRRARISFIITDPPTLFLNVGAVLESVDDVVINGESIDPERYYFDPNFNTINVLDMAAGDRVTAYFTYAEGHDELLDALHACSRSVLFGGVNRNRLFFWGNDSPGQMFCSSYVSKEQLRLSETAYPNSGPLYFPEGYEFTVGEGRCLIQGAEPHYDRLMIFTEGEVWMASEGSSGLDEFPTTNVNAKLGCASEGGVTLAENDLISVGYGTVWKWSGETERLTERNASRLSEAVDPLLSPEDYASMGIYYDRAHNELWLNVKARSEIWVYHLTHKKWYRFGEIVADSFFDAGGTLGFLRDGKIFVFEEAIHYDLTESGTQRAIQAEYVSPIIDFGNEKRKNLTGITLRGNLGGADVQVSFSGSGAEEVSRTLSDPDHEHSVLCRRLSSGGFRYGQVRLNTTGNTCPVIHSLTLRAR